METHNYSSIILKDKTTIHNLPRSPHRC
uniref:Uncharacterized protein n=1 Tax=Anguilla anguilla TaxID=7936 RepID=A0A0E9W1C4_ANGAN